MDYKKYKQLGCGIIGSGAIESAHRTVVQKRMKQSGQRWSSMVAQNMLNISCLTFQVLTLSTRGQNISPDFSTANCQLSTAARLIITFLVVPAPKLTRGLVHVRVTYMNEKWDNVIQLVKTNLKIAA